VRRVSFQVDGIRVVSHLMRRVACIPNSLQVAAVLFDSRFVAYSSQSTAGIDWRAPSHASIAAESVSKHLHTVLLANRFQLEPVVGIEPEVPM